MSNRISRDLLASLREYQRAPDEVPPPAKVLHPGVKSNRQLERWYAWHGGKWQGAFASEQDAIAAASGQLSAAELLEAKLR